MQDSGFSCAKDEFFEKVGLSCGSIVEDEELITMKPSDDGVNYVYKYAGEHSPKIEEIPRFSLLVGANKNTHVLVGFKSRIGLYFAMWCRDVQSIYANVNILK